MTQKKGELLFVINNFTYQGVSRVKNYFFTYQIISNHWLNNCYTNNIKKDGVKYVNVFVPTTPNPTSGFLLIIDKKNIKQLKISKTEALEFIITTGIINSK